MEDADKPAVHGDHEHARKYGRPASVKSAAALDGIDDDISGLPSSSAQLNTNTSPGALMTILSKQIFRVSAIYGLEKICLYRPIRLQRI
jgi:hypothetical protein